MSIVMRIPSWTRSFAEDKESSFTVNSNVPVVDEINEIRTPLPVVTSFIQNSNSTFGIMSWLEITPSSMLHSEKKSCSSGFN